MLIAVLLAGALCGETPIPFLPRRVQSPGGVHYFDIRTNKAYELGRVGGGKLKEGALARLPEGMHVLDGSPDVILFESFGRLGHDDCVYRLGVDGRVRWRVRLDALFDKATIARFPRSMISIWWYRAWWVDEERGRVVLVAKGGLLREVALDTGAVSRAEPKAVLDGVRLEYARAVALEVAGELGLKGVRPLAEPLVADVSQPLLIRLRAAIAVQRAGGAPAPLELFERALATRLTHRERRFVLHQSAAVLGVDAIGILERAVADPATTHDGIRAMVALGNPGARALANVIANGDTSSRTRQYAAETMAKLPGDVVGRAILAELQDANARVAGALLQAGIAGKVPELHRLVQPYEETLLEVVKKDTASIEWLAEHFTRHPSTEAVKPLLKALRRHANNTRRKRRILDALRACTGLDYGSNPKSWYRALGG